MKILFINKYDNYGGAGIASFRLSDALKNFHNTENLIAVGEKKSNRGEVICIRKNKFEKEIERYLSFSLNMVGFHYMYFPFSTKRLIKLTNDFKPDIISLHNIHGGYFDTSLIQRLSKLAPIVWTLHDMWAFTVSSAYTYSDDNWQLLKTVKNESTNPPLTGINWGGCMLKRKKQIYENSNITFVTPSKWLENEGSKSPALKNKKIITIPNGLDLNVYKLINKSEVRKKINIPPNSNVIIFGAEKTGDKRKGGKELLEILSKLNKEVSEKIYLLIFGKGDIAEIKAFNNFIIRELGYISDDEQKNEILGAADVLLYPTKADNLPTVPIEALASGTPSIIFNIGGCSEIITDSYNGYLIRPFETEDFANKTYQLLTNESLKKEFQVNSRKSAEDKYSDRQMAERYFNLFNRILHEK